MENYMYKIHINLILLQPQTFEKNDFFFRIDGSYLPAFNFLPAYLRNCADKIKHIHY